MFKKSAVPFVRYKIWWPCTFSVCWQKPFPIGWCEAIHVIKYHTKEACMWHVGKVPNNLSCGDKGRYVIGWRVEGQLKFITYQHCCSKIKFMEKLSNKNMYLKDIGNILLLYIPQNLNEPLKVTMWRADPQEVHLQFHSWYSNWC